MAEATWYVAAEGGAVGPFDLARLKQMAAAGALARGDLVYPAGGSEWAAAATVPGLFPPPAATPAAAAPAAAATVPPRCVSCGAAFGPPDPMGGDVSCSACGAVRGAYLAGLTAAFAAAFALAVLAAAHAGSAWLRVAAVAAAGFAACWLPVTRDKRLRTAGAGGRGEPAPGAQTPRHVRAWTAAACAAYLGAAALALCWFAPGPDGPGTPPAPLPAPAAPAAFPGFVLRGGAFRDGDAITVTTRTDVTGGRVRITHPDGSSEEGALTSNRLRSDEWTLGQVAGRAPYRMTARMLRSDLREQIGDGPATDRTAPPGLAGALVAEFSRASPGAPWSKRLAPAVRAALERAGGELLDRANDDVEACEAWDPRDELYPTGPVGVGHEWVRAGAGVRALLGGRAGDDVDGEVRLRFEGFVPLRGAPCARVTFSVTGRGTIRLGDAGPMSFTLVATGTVVRSIECGVDVWFSMTGTRTNTWRVPGQAGASTAVLTTPLTVTERVTVRPGPPARDGTGTRSAVTDADIDAYVAFLCGRGGGAVPQAQATPSGPPADGAPMVPPGRRPKTGGLFKYLNPKP
ncbi:: DUF4339 [Gemmataceae bacterium]|nr:: DUF4339 [Gemmataceae bacterium]VTU00884.1 : DUF4339 [Gemmataceae bacterium]